MMLPPRQFIVKKGEDGAWLPSTDLACYRQDLLPGLYTLSIQMFDFPISPEANAYYWKVVVGMIAAASGHTPLTTHEILKQMFLPEPIPGAGGIDEIQGGTTRGGRRKLWIFIEEIRGWAADFFKIEIPDPHCWDLSDARTKERFGQLGRVRGSQKTSLTK